MQKKLAQLCRLVLSDVNTRNLFFFLLLNLFFAFVELTYGLLTNSLGLISDSFHMFFDCSALLLGLAASIVTKWKPSDKFTYGFGRAEILAGLANGLFLLFIALFIMKEAIERTFEPPEVHHERLFVISVLGFIVNLIGIFVFQHGGQAHHHHGQGGCSSHTHSHAHNSHSKLADSHNHNHHKQHGDDHNSHNYNHYSSPTIHHYSNTNDNNNQKQQASGVVALDMNGHPPQFNNNNNNHLHNHNHHHTPTPCTATHNHTTINQHYHHHHDDHHQHNHYDAEPLLYESGVKPKTGRGQIMQSVFLHIVADTLGSVGVMISALLMNQFGWMIADPLCSLFIAILISVSVYPLLRDSFYILMQRIPVELEDKLPSCLNKIQKLTGVTSVHETHFWTLNSDTFIGCLKLEATSGANQKFILTNAKALLNEIGVDRVHIQIDQI